MLPFQVEAGNDVVEGIADQVDHPGDPLRGIRDVHQIAPVVDGVSRGAVLEKFEGGKMMMIIIFIIFSIIFVLVVIIRSISWFVFLFLFVSAVVFTITVRVLVRPTIHAVSPAVRLGDDVLAVGQRAMVEGGLWVRHVGSLWVPGVDRQRGRCPGAVVCLDAVVGGKGGVGGPGHHSHGEGRSAVGKGGQPGDARIHGGGDVVLEKVVVFFVFVLRIVLGITVQVRYGSGQRFRIRVVIRVLAPLTGDSHVGIAVGIVVVAVVVVRVCAIPFPPSSNRIYRYSLGFP
mmetsp:Transcript_5939/g.14752  ORF Transcript_5939/g.14752 Transcript_5939/m.14752 type:complete len:287 (-) Transcript_5939:147-1007(-)